MVEIISSGKNTQWHSFPNFQTKCSYSHIANEPVDFQVFPGSKCFLEVNKKSGFELLRTYTQDGHDKIQRVKKRQMEDLYCGATSKMNGSEVALGMTTGYIRMFNLNTGDFVASKLRPDKLGVSVMGLDYTNCDEFLAGLYENGDINFYGLKTGIKTDVFRLDGNSTMIRFHPKKRFYLAAASYLGAVTILDTQSKRKIFTEKTAHSSPCRDIAMSGAAPDMLVSCGYDCKVNIYDSRKRNSVYQITQNHPLSCVSISPCANYLCTGNLKGDITSFDIRNLKDHLDTKRVHDGNVVRVAFIPAISEVSECDRYVSRSSISTTNPTPSVSMVSQPSGGVDNTDSFIKFVDLCHVNNNAARKSSMAKRDSWMDLEVRPVHDFSMDSEGMSPSHLSLAGDHSELRLKRGPRITASLSTTNDITNLRKAPRISEIFAITEEQPEDRVENDSKRPKTNDISNDTNKAARSDLNEADEDVIPQSDNVDSELKARRLSYPKLSIGNKENQQHNQQDIDMFAKFLKDGYVSTPNSNYVPNKAKSAVNSFNCNDQNMELMKRMVGEVIDTKLNDFQTSISSRLEALETSVVEKINKAENENKFYQDQYFNLGFSGNFRLFKLMEKEIDSLKEGMAVLLREDVIGQEYYRLKAENEELKRRLEKR